MIYNIYVIYIYIYIHIYIYIFIYVNIYRVEYKKTISVVTWRTVHEHLVEGTFRSKKSSSAVLVHEQQGPKRGCLSSFNSTA